MKLAIWKYFYRFFRPCRRFLILNLLVAAGQSLTFLPMLILVRQIFDKAIPAGKIQLLVIYCGGVVVLILLNMLLILLTRRGAIRAVKLAIHDLRNDLTQRFCAFSRSYYSQIDINHLRFTLLQDTERLDNMSISLLTQAFPAFLVSLTISLLLVYINWRLFLAVALVSSLTLGIAWKMRRSIFTANTRYRISQKQFGRGIVMLLQIMDLTRTLGAEESEIERQRSASDALRTESQRLESLKTAYLELQNTIVASTGAVILLVGGAAIIYGKMSLGGLISFYFLTMLLGNYLKGVWSSLPLIISGNEALKALEGIVHSSDRPPYSGSRRIQFRGEISLANVTFGYDEGTILKEVNLHLTPGRMIALAGPNGSGKSTIVYLILGFYHPQSGKLFADGIAYDQLDLQTLRRRIGLVPQNPIIFPGTIRENISYGYQARPLDEIIHACNLSTAHDFIADLSDGYDTMVGENGMLLSGGQRQRIAIARALLGKPKVLILDEPANHLDRVSLQRLMENIRDLEFAPAILLISHKADFHTWADRTYWLEDARFQEIDSRFIGQEGKN